MATLQVLLVEAGSGEHPGRDQQEGMNLLAANGFADAVEAMSIQRFDAVVVCGPVADAELAAFTGNLRSREAAQHSGRIPVLLLTAGEVADCQTQGLSFADAVLTGGLSPTSVREAIAGLSGARTATRPVTESEPVLPEFELANFREQMGEDESLMVEIIGLFLDECGGQIDAIREFVASNDLLRASEMAHAIKGSLASLQAPLARALAQKLELSAKRNEAIACAGEAEALAAAVESLKAVLIGVRSSLSET